MTLIIVRHGKADDDSPTGRDQDRRLKARGRRQAAHLAEQLASGPLRPALILSSSFERARATAAEIHESVDCELRFEPVLQVGHPPSAVLDLVQRHAAADPLVLVGHNPQLGRLIGLLTGGTPATEAELRTGEAVVIDVDPRDPIGHGKEVRRIRLDEGD